MIVHVFHQFVMSAESFIAVFEKTVQIFFENLARADPIKMVPIEVIKNLISYSALLSTTHTIFFPSKRASVSNIFLFTLFNFNFTIFVFVIISIVKIHG